MLAGLIYVRVNTGKGSRRFPVGKPGYVANLGDKLWAIGLSNAIDAHYSTVFRKCGC